MEIGHFNKTGDYLWEIPRAGMMRVPARIYATEKILRETDKGAIGQIANVASLNGIVKYAVAMPDIHLGHGSPIGGVGAMDIETGVISPGFVGYDQNCGCRLLISDLSAEDISPWLNEIASRFQRKVPSGLGQGRAEKMSIAKVELVLKEGVPHLVSAGYGVPEDVERCEERGKMEGADPKAVSERAKERGRDQLGTLGSGNHFCEIQRVEKVIDKEKAQIFGLFEGQAVVMIHTGSRGLGHQNCTDYLKIVTAAMGKYGIKVPDRELASVPFHSPEGERFFAALSAACNYAWANRQTISHHMRMSWEEVFGAERKLELLYDVAHNIAKIEEHNVNGLKKRLIVHRKGATRAFPQGHSEIPVEHKGTGQVVLIPGSMGTASYVLSGTKKSDGSWHTVCHGAGRRMSRRAALRSVKGTKVIEELTKKGIIVKCQSTKGIAEEAPGMYKDIDEVVEVVVGAGLADRVARLKPMAVIKGE